MKTNSLKIIAHITAACITLLGLTFPKQACAQLMFTGDNQTNIVNGTFAPVLSPFYIGSNYVFDALFILNGGSVQIASTYVGYETGGNSNLVSVSGNGSGWTNTSFRIGYRGSGNRLVISDGGRIVSSSQGIVGSYGDCNSVLVAGTGAVWITPSLWMGDGGAYNSMVVSNAGSVFANVGYVGGNWNGGGRSNTMVVTGAGSVWSNSFRLNVGYMNRGNTLIISNGGTVFNADVGIIGTLGNAANNQVLVTGSGSVWRSSADLYVGWGTGSGTNATNNQLTVADGALVLAANAIVGITANASNSLINVSGGNLTVTNVSGTGVLDVRRGRLAFDGGTIMIERLWLTNGIASILEFNSGTLHSRSTVVSNAQPCVVGDAVASANLHLLGGVHTFQNGLRIRTNSFLTGCGTVNGSVVIDAGGAIHANCTNLVFNSSVTNNGSIVVDGAVLETFGTLVNNGRIFLINGGTTNFHGAFINSGAILNGDVRLTIEQAASGGLFVRYAGVPTVIYRLQRAAHLIDPWSDVATNTTPASGLVEYHETSPMPDQTFYRTVRP